MIEQYKSELRGNPLERLRWLVCRNLGVFPSADIADEDVIRCGIHMVIDREN